MILTIGAILGFISVAFGAYAEHAMRDAISAEEFRYIMTAVRYNQIHAVAVVALGLSQFSNGKIAATSLIRYAATGFIVGTALFSFSIYIAVWLGIEALLMMTPIGGMTLMASWLLLAFAGYRLKKSG